MKKLLFISFWVLPVFAISFDHYHSQQEIKEYIQNLALKHPGIVRAEKIGISDENREIWVAIVEKNVSMQLPAIYLNGTHHGNEKSSTESALAFLDYVVTNQATQPIAELLEKYVLIVQPIVNPDGHAKSKREDALGRDPNRDYAYPERPEEKSFRSKIIQNVRGFLNKYSVRAAVAYHSGMEAVLWPWCYSGNAETKDLFYTLSKHAADAMGFKNFRQSYYDYPTNGEFTDYFFMKEKTLAVTFEVSGVSTPSTASLSGVVKRAVKGTLAYLQSVQSWDRGTLLVETAPESPMNFNPRFVRLGRRVE